MKLTKIKLFNYRCFGPDEQIIKIDDLTTFIGNNSAGKTAALSALNCMFSENSSDRLLQRSDFHIPKKIAPDSMENQSLYIKAVFEFDELKGKEQNGEYSIPQYFQHLIVDEPPRPEGRGAGPPCGGSGWSFYRHICGTATVPRMCTFIPKNQTHCGTADF